MELVTSGCSLFQDLDWAMFQSKRFDVILWRDLLCHSLERLPMFQVMQSVKEAFRITINFTKCRRVAENNCCHWRSHCIYPGWIGPHFQWDMVGNVRKSVGNNRSKQKCIVLDQLTRCADHTKLLYSFWDLVSFLFSKRVDRSRHKMIFLGCDLDCYGLRDLLLSPGHEPDARMQSLCRDLSVEAALFLMIPQHLPAFRERINPGTRYFKKEKKSSFELLDVESKS